MKLNQEKVYFHVVSSAYKWEITHDSVKAFGKHFERIKGSVIFLDFQSTKQGLPLVDSCSWIESL